MTDTPARTPQDAPIPQDAPRPAFEACRHDGDSYADYRLCSAKYTWFCALCGFSEERWFEEFAPQDADPEKWAAEHAPDKEDLD